MIKNSIKTTLLLICFLFSLNVLSVGFGGKVRSGQTEASFKVNHLEDMKIKGGGGSAIHVKDDVGYGLEFSYNIDDHMNASFEFSSNYAGYTATLMTEGANARSASVRNKMDIYNSQFNFTYHFSKNEITPFISGGLGWSYIDSNIANGEALDVCWWDPWWGYICSATQSTYSETNFSYNAEFGVRLDVSRQLYFTGSYGVVWYDFDHADTASTEMIKLEIGAKF